MGPHPGEPGSHRPQPHAGARGLRHGHRHLGSSGLRYVAFIGNYRAGEESGSARWGTLKEGKAFRDATNEDNNLIFTKNFGLALHRPKFDPELDRNLNVLVVGGSGSGKTRNYVTPNIMQLNTSYFINRPEGHPPQGGGVPLRGQRLRGAVVQHD